MGHEGATRQSPPLWGRCPAGQRGVVPTHRTYQMHHHTRFSLSTAINTRSGVAGASSLGQTR
jgi:hypothetical protein